MSDTERTITFTESEFHEFFERHRAESNVAFASELMAAMFRVFADRLRSVEANSNIESYAKGFEHGVSCAADQVLLFSNRVITELNRFDAGNQSDSSP